MTRLSAVGASPLTVGCALVEAGLEVVFPRAILATMVWTWRSRGARFWSRTTRLTTSLPTSPANTALRARVARGGCLVPAIAPQRSRRRSRPGCGADSARRTAPPFASCRPLAVDRARGTAIRVLPTCPSASRSRCPWRTPTTDGIASSSPVCAGRSADATTPRKVPASASISR